MTNPATATPAAATGPASSTKATLTLNDVAVSGNTTTGSGGGVYNDTTGTLTLLRSDHQRQHGRRRERRRHLLQRHCGAHHLGNQRHRQRQ
ncbi:MAG: hypothetical protein MZV70_66050 [Desulfobacterales bacterium]|nr:hypothetical protein [Desulfobacterales bacterium]